ncbi:MAG: Na+/H+ antiporter NhaA [Proteobacteria bacterium]|nr:Na+/H+ antiporter NhaA [Pseudomonadota bacterium]
MSASKQAPIEILMHPFNRFFKTSASGGLVLLACTAIAMVWANSPWSASYSQFREVPLSLGFADQTLSLSLKHWVNDGVMAVFFFVVGLEIKRELLVGELSTARKALLPIVAAIGGMLAPAALYLVFNSGTPHAAGWGVPITTDIAFALGILSLFGRRVPVSLKVFLTAVAIADDMSAVLVIALFYTANLSLSQLGLGLALLALMAAANALGVRKPLVYLLLGVGAWLLFFHSGVHATVSGVIAAMAIPARSKSSSKDFLTRCCSILEEYQALLSADRGSMLESKRQPILLQTLRETCRDAETPLQSIEAVLHPWVAFLVMPLFALVNAGVALPADMAQALAQPVNLGILCGLMLGKPLGVCLAAAVMMSTGLAPRPEGVTWRHMLGAGCLAGIGFTMSIFIAELAFSDQAVKDSAKIGILGGSFVSAVLGWLVLRGAPEIDSQVES